MNKFAIIVAGGTGKRMNSQTPKQFMLIAGMPVIFYSLKAFSQTFSDIKIIVALPDELLPEWEKICSVHNLNINLTLAKGGETRFHSVKNSLSLINDDNAVIAIHDAARPIINRKTIAQLFMHAEVYGNAIPVIPVNDSVREIDKLNSKPIDRHKLCLVQTPQCFRADILKNAYRQEYRKWFTDDATVVEANGIKINLLDGYLHNIKITTPDDFLIAETLIKLKVDD